MRKTGNTIKINASGDTAELARIRAFVEQKASEVGFDEEGAYNIAWAVDEACSNVIRHSYGHDSTRRFHVEISVDARKFVILISDSGNAFDPVTFPTPNMQRYLKSHTNGGLGIHIIRKVMDDVEYRPADAAHPFNILKLVKVVD